MKIIGMLAGTSWPSSIDYYRILNQMINEKLGGHHSARLRIESIDYHEIKSSYGPEWAKVPLLLKKEVDNLAGLKPDCIMVCNNTLHKALDEIGYETDVRGVPVIHIVNETGREAARRGYDRVLLLGTAFTMEDGYYAEKLSRVFNLKVDIPAKADREQIQAIQTRLAAPEDPEQFREQFRKMLDGYRDYDAVILACTELPLAISQDVSPIPILNPTQIQCQAAVDFALGG